MDHIEGREQYDLINKILKWKLAVRKPSGWPKIRWKDYVHEDRGKKLNRLKNRSERQRRIEENKRIDRKDEKIKTICNRIVRIGTDPSRRMVLKS